MDASTIGNTDINPWIILYAFLSIKFEVFHRLKKFV